MFLRAKAPFIPQSLTYGLKARTLQNRLPVQAFRRASESLTFQIPDSGNRVLVLQAGFRSSCVFQTEVAIGLRCVFEDLGLQGLCRRPLHLSAQAQEEFEIERRIVGELDLFEVKDVRLYAEANAFEGRAVADIGDRL